MLPEIIVNLKEVFRTGKFEIIRIGKTKEWILNNFPEPDDFGIGKTLMSAKIWKYGNFEFYFNDQVLDQIFSHLDDLDVGEKIEVKKWVFKEPENMRFGNLMKILNDEKFNMLVKHDMNDSLCQTSIVLIDSGIYINFQPIEGDKDSYEDWIKNKMKRIETSNYKLVSITLNDKNELVESFIKRMKMLKL